MFIHICINVIHYKKKKNKKNQKEINQNVNISYPDR